jgi:hypothetical protein
MAMRDPSLAAAKADIRQQAIKGGEVPSNETARAVERYAQAGEWGRWHRGNGVGRPV